MFNLIMLTSRVKSPHKNGKKIVHCRNESSRICYKAKVGLKTFEGHHCTDLELERKWARLRESKCVKTEVLEEIAARDDYAKKWLRSTRRRGQRGKPDSEC